VCMCLMGRKDMGSNLG